MHLIICSGAKTVARCCVVHNLARHLDPNQKTGKQIILAGTSRPQVAANQLCASNLMKVLGSQDSQGAANQPKVPTLVQLRRTLTDLGNLRLLEHSLDFHSCLISASRAIRGLNELVAPLNLPSWVCLKLAELQI